MSTLTYILTLLKFFKSVKLQITVLLHSIFHPLFIFKFFIFEKYKNNGEVKKVAKNSLDILQDCFSLPKFNTGY